MKKLLNLEWSFSIIDSSWKNKTPIISTETFRMVLNLSKDFLQNQLFFIVWNQKQMLLVLGKIGSREAKLLNFKRSSKTFTQDTKAISNYIYLLYHSIICFHSTLLYWFPPRRTLGLHCILRAQLVIHTTHPPCCFPCHYVTNLLAYCKRIIKNK